MTARLLALFLMACLALLAGCTSSDQEEVQQWMTEQRNGTRPRVQPIPEPKKFLPQAYTQETAIEPFSLQKLAQALKRESNQANANAALVTPELNRRKEPLESYPLDAMAMVGSLTRQSQPIALVRVENLIYQIRLGSYLGQNYGKVMKISETEVALREIVQDATGEWTERTALLQLQERSK
jgi:type IV pilus assembly protein PilP